MPGRERHGHQRGSRGSKGEILSIDRTFVHAFNVERRSLTDRGHRETLQAARQQRDIERQFRSTASFTSLRLRATARPRFAQAKRPFIALTIATLVAGLGGAFRAGSLSGGPASLAGLSGRRSIMTVAECAAGFSFLMTGVQIVSTAVARFRCPARKTPLAPPTDAPPVSLIRPVCGVDNYAELTLRSSFTLDYPDYELLFCVARSDDLVLPLLRRLIAAHPHVRSSILVGDDEISPNPKLNNCVKGWSAAAHEWIIMADSNVLMPGDYIQRLLARWRPDTGLVCSTPIGSRPEGFWAEVECGFLNTLQARWQYAAEAIGFGFAQGKSMLWRREILDQRGGMRALARRDRRGCRGDEACPPLRPQGGAGRQPLRAASGRADAWRDLGQAGAMGAAAARDLPALFPAWRSSPAACCRALRRPLRHRRRDTIPSRQPRSSRPSSLPAKHNSRSRPDGGFPGRRRSPG